LGSSASSSVDQCPHTIVWRAVRLVAVAPEDERPTLPRGPSKVEGEARLADAVVARDEHDTPFPAARATELATEKAELRLAPDEDGPDEPSAPHPRRRVGNKVAHLRGERGHEIAPLLDDIRGADLDRPHGEIDRGGIDRHDDRRGDPARPQTTQRLEPVGQRQRGIEHRARGVTCGELLDRLLAREHPVHHEAVLGKRAPDSTGRLGVVFDEQHLVRHTSPRPRSYAARCGAVNECEAWMRGARAHTPVHTPVDRGIHSPRRGSRRPQ